MIVRRQSLRRGFLRVRREMLTLGLWHPDLDRVQVRQRWISVAHGYQWFGDRSGGRPAGDVVIPRISLVRIWEQLTDQKRTSLADVIRHELAHAFADLHYAWFRSKAFSKVFGYSHDATAKQDYDPEHYVSAYAATLPCEDFAETFMSYVRHRGILPKRFDKEVIRKKWKFVAGCRDMAQSSTG